jgi:hypothetical protein
LTARWGNTISTEKKPLLGSEFRMDIGSLSLENKDDEEIVLAGFSMMNLTPTVKNCWTKEIENNQGYKEVVEQVKTGKGMIDDKLGMDENGMLVWKGK